MLLALLCVAALPTALALARHAGNQAVTPTLLSATFAEPPAEVKGPEDLYCFQFEFPEEVTEEDVGFKITITEKGANSFVDAAMGMLTDIINVVQIPSLNISIDLGPFVFDVNLANIRVTSMYLDEVYFKFMEDMNVNEVAAEGIDIKLTFDFSLIGHMVPPIQDEGWGEIAVSGAEFYADVAILASEICPYHIEVSGSSASLDLHSMDIEFHSDLGAIYNSIFKLLEEKIISMLNEMMSTLLMNQILEFINTQLFNIWYASPEFETTYINPVPFEEAYVSDLRIVDGLHFADASISLHYPGITYKNDNLECYYERPEEVPHMVNDRDIQYLFDKVVFSSAYYSWHKYDNAYAFEVTAQDSEAAEEYLSPDALELVFPGITAAYPELSLDNTEFRFQPLEAPYVQEVTDTGLYTTINATIDVLVGEETVATVETATNVLGRPETFSIRTGPTLNGTTFYLSSKYVNGTSSAVVADDAADVDQEELDDWVKGIFKDIILDMMAETMKTRSVVTDNGDYTGQRKPQIVYLAPRHVALTYDLSEPAE